MIERQVYDGGYFIEDAAVAEMLDADVLFVGTTMRVLVLCNDLFDWGTADGEPVEYNELESLYKAYKEDRVEQWCCLHRKMRPQHVLEMRWKAAGAWTPELEALPVRETDHFNPPYVDKPDADASTWPYQRDDALGRAIDG